MILASPHDKRENSISVIKIETIPCTKINDLTISTECRVINIVPYPRQEICGKDKSLRHNTMGIPDFLLDAPQ